MREIIAVCRSEKKSRTRVASVLDRYFWRIGSRTWRGKASNACLDRVSRELRKSAKRNTAVVIHEIRSSHESRTPIIRIGSRSAFSDEGLVPVASNPAEYKRRRNMSDTERTVRAVVCIAALFHDLGKATVLFQDKLKRAMKGGKPEADSVRHEMFSAAVWDKLFGEVEDEVLTKRLSETTAAHIDLACEEVIQNLVAMTAKPNGPIGFGFVAREGSLAHLIGMLILTHHRLPEGDSDFVTPTAFRHVSEPESAGLNKRLVIAPGKPFWHEQWWLDALKVHAEYLVTNRSDVFGEMILRASLMFADHLGSNQKKESEFHHEHLANTKLTESKPTRSLPADSLSKHTSRVYKNALKTIDIFFRYKDSFPGIDEAQLPVDVAFPRPSSDKRFLWQCKAAEEARQLCKSSEGGFFACLLAGTGTGKTRAAPTILANAAMADARAERRYFRVCLALGLRVLATQSAQEYVSDLGFNKQDVAVLVGQAPLDFDKLSRESLNDAPDGSGSLLALPSWLQIEGVKGVIPEIGDSAEEDWLRTLSLNTERGLPAVCELILEAAGKRNQNGRRLLEPPVLVGTIDHLMDVASPVNSRFLVQSVRVSTSDLIIDEIDQFNGEDIAAIGRLIYQSASMGRRVIIMSATLTTDIASALFTSYTAGWSKFAKAHEFQDNVNVLVSGDSVETCFTTTKKTEFLDAFNSCRSSVVKCLETQPISRRSEILEPCSNWLDLVQQIDKECARLHNLNAFNVASSSGKEFSVSVGLVRLTRISHTASVAAQLSSGKTSDRMRFVLCLHSQFPRLQRSWIETRLRRALTRKGENSNAGVVALCQAEGLFDKATEQGVCNIEIVVVASPVIETGNDLDFDWAVIDPISTRSIIQTAGRVWRHRPLQRQTLSVSILGRSVVAIEDGELKNPGVETPLAKDTKISKPSLRKFENRNFKELAGDFDFDYIDASPVLSEQGSFPLRDAEQELRLKLLRSESDSPEAPLGRYLQRTNARLNWAISKSRQFRRSSRGTVLFKLIGDDFDTASWYLDQAPGTRESCFKEAKSCGLTISYLEGDYLFTRFASSAWSELSNGSELSSGDVSRLMQVEVPDYRSTTFLQEMTYTPFTGFTRGSAEDLFEPFGRG